MKEGLNLLVLLFIDIQFIVCYIWNVIEVKYMLKVGIMYYYSPKKKILVEWCPICNKLLEVETNSFDEYNEVLTTYKCCGETMIDIDYDIADIVIDFNKEGYITKFSCSGHSIDSPGYIYFKEADRLILYLVQEECKKYPHINFEYNLKNQYAGEFTLRFHCNMNELSPTKTGNVYTKKNFIRIQAKILEELRLLVNSLPLIQGKRVTECKNGYAYV